MPNLALFDFDGTITESDTFTPFIYYAVSKQRLILGRILLAPLILGYKLRLISGSPVRQSIVFVGFSGKAKKDIKSLGMKYAAASFPNFIRKDALRRIQWHKDRGDTVAIVSSSLDAYLTDWCFGLGLELICTELDSLGNYLTGFYRGGDCAGEEKAKRIRQKFDLNSYNGIYAYGDTIDNDGPMLSLADKKYFRWQETGEISDIYQSPTAKIDPNHEIRKAELQQENLHLKMLVQRQ